MQEAAAVAQEARRAALGATGHEFPDALAFLFVRGERAWAGHIGGGCAVGRNAQLMSRTLFGNFPFSTSRRAFGRLDASWKMLSFRSPRGKRKCVKS